MKPSRGPSLVAALSFVLLAELLASRLGVRLLGEVALSSRTRFGVTLAGTFAFHAATVLSVLLSSLAIIRLLGVPRRDPAPPPYALGWRAVVVVSLVGFLFVSGVGVVESLPTRLRVYLAILLALLFLEAARSSWPATVGAPAARGWLVLVTLSVWAHAAWMLLAELGLEERLRAGRVALTAGEALVATAAIVGPLALVPRPPPSLRWRVVVPAVLLGAAGTATAALVAHDDWMLAARIAAYGFGLELPAAYGGVLLDAVAFGFWLGTTVALLARPGASRLRGWGLALLGLSGYQLELPYQVSSALLGILCVTESYLRERAAPLPDDRWRALVRRLAAAVGSSEVIVVGDGLSQEARVTGVVGPTPVELVAVREAGRLARLELSAGDAPVDDAPLLSLQRRGAPRLGRRQGVEVATGDLGFDADFLLHDARRLVGSDPILDDSTRPRLRAQVDGWLGLWPGRGARLRSVGGPMMSAVVDESDGAVEAIRDRLTLLVELVGRAG